MRRHEIDGEFRVSSPCSTRNLYDPIPSCCKREIALEDMLDKESRDHLYLRAEVRSARSTTGFKLSVLRGSLNFQLSRNYTATKVEVIMEGFKSVRILEQGRVNMNASNEMRDMSEHLCRMTWILAEDIDIVAGNRYTFEFSGLLDSRLPRTLKAGNSRTYYRLSADIPNLRSIKTETRLTIPWSRSAVFASEEINGDVEKSSIAIDHDFATIEMPTKVIKGPNRDMAVSFYTSKSAKDMHITKLEVEVLQDVTMTLEKLREPHHEPYSVVQQTSLPVPSSCSMDSPLLITLPLPAEIHAEMKSPHMNVSHSLRVTVHRDGVRRAKVHRQPLTIYHFDADRDHELPLIEDVLSKDFSDPQYEYNSMDQKYADEKHNFL